MSNIQNIPTLTPDERKSRNAAKREKMLAFIASETWTDIATAAMLLNVSTNTAGVLLRALERDGLLKRETIPTGTPRAVWIVFGITPTGVNRSTASIASPEHQLGRLKSANIAHSLAVQRVRIIAERAGWRDFVPGRALYKKGLGLPIIPDALATDPQGRRVAIELERNVKSATRRAEVISGHVVAIAQRKHWHRVLYVCDDRTDKTRLRDQYMSLTEIKTPAGIAKFTDAHRERFEFINLIDFKG